MIPQAGGYPWLITKDVPAEECVAEATQTADTISQLISNLKEDFPQDIRTLEVYYDCAGVSARFTLQL